MRTFLASLFLASTLSAATLPTGYYVMQAVDGQNVKDSVIASPALTGYHIRNSWNMLESNKGVLNYAYFDTQLARAARLNKHTTIGVYSGVLSDPGWGNSIDEYVNVIAALGARYNSNPLIDAVHMSAPQVTNHSMEMYLPGFWTGTDAAAITIWERSIAAYGKAFPDKTLVLDLAMAPDAGGAITKAVDEYARATLGSRFEAIVCNLKATTSTTAPHIRELERLRAEGVRIGFEMVGPSTDTSRFGGSFSKAISIGNSLGGSWYQIYQADVPNLRLASGPTPEPPNWAPVAIAIFIILIVYRPRRIA